MQELADSNFNTDDAIKAWEYHASQSYDSMCSETYSRNPYFTVFIRDLVHNYTENEVIIQEFYRMVLVWMLHEYYPWIRPIHILKNTCMVKLRELISDFNGDCELILYGLHRAGFIHLLIGSMQYFKNNR